VNALTCTAVREGASRLTHSSIQYVHRLKYAHEPHEGFDTKTDWLTDRLATWFCLWGREKASRAPGRPGAKYLWILGMKIAACHPSGF